MEEQILAKLNRLEQLILYHGMLGFSGGRRFVYVQSTKQGLWSDIATDEPITAKALTGYLLELHRKEDTVPKLHVTIKTRDEEVVLCSGFETNFSRDIMAAIAQLSPEQIAAPIKVVPQLIEKPKKGQPYVAGNVISVLDDRVIYTQHVKAQNNADQLFVKAQAKLSPQPPKLKAVAPAPKSEPVDWKALCQQYNILPPVIKAIACELGLPERDLNAAQSARLFHALQSRGMIA